MCEVIVKSSIIKSVIDSYKDNITEGIWKFSNDGITMQAIDTSHVFICEMKLSKESFSSFVCNSPVSVGISFNNLAKILKCSSNDDAISLKLIGKTNIIVSFKNKGSNRSSKFDLKTIEIFYENVNIPETVFDCNIYISSKEFKSIMSDLSQFGEDCVINVSVDVVNFSVKGDIGEGNVSLTNLKFDVKPVKVTFSIKHLLNFTKATAMSDDLNLCISDGCPMMINYRMEHDSYVKFYLAPKLDSE